MGRRIASESKQTVRGGPKPAKVGLHRRLIKDMQFTRSYPESTSNDKNALFGTFPIGIRQKKQGFSKHVLYVRRITKNVF